ncbi:MAG: hypothetical protein BWZ10_02243 [candidate division BRC1 bacterium ADurb.BinA364]|nr:MAG: hypothetical protein BWZ10_02243 [candidate division BRC1 bacterium ADurb.BinA364]
MVDLPGTDLFRSHVMNRSNDAAFLSQVRLVRQASQAEIHHFHFIGPRQNHDVFRLDIAVDDRCAVSRGQRFGDLRAIMRDFGNRQLGFREQFFAQIGAVYVFHGDRALAGVADDIVNGDDARMRQLGNGACLVQKTIAVVLPRRQVRRQHFPGHSAAQLRILGQIDHAHAAFAQFSNNAVSLRFLLARRRDFSGIHHADRRRGRSARADGG